MRIAIPAVALALGLALSGAYAQEERRERRAEKKSKVEKREPTIRNRESHEGRVSKQRERPDEIHPEASVVNPCNSEDPPNWCPGTPRQ